MTEDDKLWQAAKANSEIAAWRGTPNTRDKTDAWLEQLGMQFVEVFLIRRDGSYTTERHVNDAFTLPEAVAMSMSTTGAVWAVYPDGDRWALTGKGKTRYYPTREAAEMVAIHRGK